jgi:hypothetical protein
VFHRCSALLPGVEPFREEPQLVASGTSEVVSYPRLGRGNQSKSTRDTAPHK